MKKLNTVPHGSAVIVTLYIETAVCFICFLFMLPKKEAWYVFTFFLAFALSALYFISKKYLNFLYISNDMILYKNEKLKWEDAYITMSYMRPRVDRNAYDYYFYFSDHYLSKDEIESQNLLQKGFYIILTVKRIEYICSLYRKEVRILEEAPYRRVNHWLLEPVKTHNSKIRAME